MKKLFLVLLSVLIISCNKDDVDNNPYNLTKTLDATYFTLETPEDWELYIPPQYFGEYSGYITNNIDTITFDMGYFAFGGLHTIIENESMSRFEELMINNACAKLVKGVDDGGYLYFFMYLESEEFGLNFLNYFNFTRTNGENEELIEAIFKTHKFKNP